MQIAHSALALLLMTLGACQSPPPPEASSPTATADGPAGDEAPTAADPESAASPLDPSSEGGSDPGSNELLPPSSTPRPPAPAGLDPSPSAEDPAAAARAEPTVKPKAKPAEPTKASKAAYSGAQPCHSKSLSVEPVISACQEGGRKGAKQVMKQAIAKAKAAGTQLKCPSCHVDTNGYGLKSNALTDLKRWL